MCLAYWEVERRGRSRLARDADGLGVHGLASVDRIGFGPAESLSC
jgi:hypothetical protein